MSAILQKSGENRIYFHSLDLLRALAAFLVVLSHARNCFMREYQPEMSAALKPFYFVSDLGHEAVIIFFVLSGCVVGRIVLRGIQTQTWSWRDYLFDRLTRLWIVLLPALVLTAILDTLSLALSPPESFVHIGGDFARIFSEPLSDQLSLPIFLGNAFYLQTIFVPTFGSNSPLWSLANEFWYYLMFPLLLLGLKPGPSWLPRLASLLGGIAILLIAGEAIASLFPVWLFGAAAFALFQKMPPRHVWMAPGLWGASLTTLALLTLSRIGTLPACVGLVVSDNLLGLACALLVYFALGAQPPALLSNIAGFFSKFSYSVYLLHLPLITLVAALLIGTNDHRLPASFTSIIIVVAALIGIYLYAYGVFLLTENNTSRIRQWLKSRIKLSGS